MGVDGWTRCPRSVTEHPRVLAAFMRARLYLREPDKEGFYCVSNGARSVRYSDDQSVPLAATSAQRGNAQPATTAAQLKRQG